MNFSMYILESSKAELASEMAVLKAPGSSAGVVIFLIPLPPPPAAAFRNCRRGRVVFCRDIRRVFPYGFAFCRSATPPTIAHRHFATAGRRNPAMPTTSGKRGLCGKLNDKRKRHQTAACTRCHSLIFLKYPLERRGSSEGPKNDPA